MATGARYSVRNDITPSLYGSGYIKPSLEPFDTRSIIGYLNMNTPIKNFRTTLNKYKSTHSWIDCEKVQHYIRTIRQIYTIDCFHRNRNTHTCNNNNFSVLLYYFFFRRGSWIINTHSTRLIILSMAEPRAREKLSVIVVKWIVSQRKGLNNIIRTGDGVEGVQTWSEYE